MIKDFNQIHQQGNNANGILVALPKLVVAKETWERRVIAQYFHPPS